MIIGLTGQIGAGKSSAAKVLARLGAVVVDADRIGREIVEQSAKLRMQLVGAFGKQIIGADGKLRRSKLAELAFANQNSRDKLNKLVHPHLLKELRSQVNRATRAGKTVVIDAALLLYWEMDREVDTVLVIHAGRELRYKRLAKRGVSRSDALARQRAQLPFAEFRSGADRLILNNGSAADLRRKITAYYTSLSSNS